VKTLGKTQRSLWLISAFDAPVAAVRVRAGTSIVVPSGRSIV
jgi:hypothetical protein